jgi:hypothetical protein
VLCTSYTIIRKRVPQTSTPLSVDFIPAAFGRHIENLGNDELAFLELFRTDLPHGIRTAHCIAAANLACTHRGFSMKKPWLPGNGHGVKLALPGSARSKPIASARSYVHCVKMSS